MIHKVTGEKDIAPSPETGVVIHAHPSPGMGDGESGEVLNSVEMGLAIIGLCYVMGREVKVQDRNAESKSSIR